MSFHVAVRRLLNIDVELSKEDLENLSYLERLRNGIVHHHVEIGAEEVAAYVAKGMQFVDRFLRGELKLTLDKFLSPDEHKALKEIVYNYSERMKAISALIEKEFTGRSIENIEVCRVCGEKSIPMEKAMIGKKAKCYFCDSQHKVHSCYDCHKPCTYGQCDGCAEEIERQLQEAYELGDYMCIL